MNAFYQEDLLEMYKNPIHKGSISDASVSISKENTMCGDMVTLDLKIENNIIKDAKFGGQSCLVSVVSTDIFLEEIIGKSIDEAKALTKDDLLGLLKLNLTTSRVKCAILILGAFNDAIKKYEESL